MGLSLIGYEFLLWLDVHRPEVRLTDTWIAYPE